MDTEPEYLYKYRNLDGHGFRFAVDMVVNNRVYLSSRNQMNDPDEGRYDSVRSDGPIDKDVYRRLIDMIDNDLRACCFCPRVTNPLMWAHYAGGFSGVAFQYRTEDLRATGLPLEKVVYQGRPKLTYTDAHAIVHDGRDPVECGIFKSKADHWFYEREYRLIGKERKMPFAKGIKPSAVILGLKPGEGSDARDSIQELCISRDIPYGYLLPNDDSDDESLYYVYYAKSNTGEYETAENINLRI